MIRTHQKVFLLSVLLLYALTACNNSAGNSSNNNAQPDSNALPPVETQKPNTNYKPAFPGQTRAPGAKTETPLAITVIDSTLENPWAICPLPDGRFLLTQNKGTMCIVSADGRSKKQITGLPAVVSDGQGGLLDVNIDPDFSNNRVLYWTFSEKRAEGTLLSVAKGKLSTDESKVEDALVIYRATPAFSGNLQYGSRILFDKAGNLLVSTGERSAKEIRDQAQDLNSSLGKIIHITPDGDAVPGGPFANKSKARPEVYAYGLRNPDGLAWNPETGELWEAEFGPRGGDEINIIHAGRNYGWPVITYGIEYSGEKVGHGTQTLVGMEQPVYYWDPVISPGDITFYDGDMIPEWKNNLFVAGLSSMHIARLIIKDGKVIGEERLLQDKGERFRALAMGKDGALYAATDGGKMYRIAKK
ncbi:PQQ-dependent sugar dehydrogenase [Olivibacter ginsenosidimutans]